MCGIVGIWHLNKEPADLQLLQQMTDCIRYRGPDDEGHYIDDNLGLGSRRLSIIDLSSAAHMPMPNEDKTVWIIYNGEVYNYMELSEPLKEKGHQFRSKTDTEVVLHAYETYGPDCLNHFNGMWSFAIWDKNRQQLFCAIDRFGIKPFYYYFDGRVFVFGSEIKSILLHPNVSKKINDQTVFDYLAYNYLDHQVDTFFAGIKRLPPAHFLTLDTRGLLSIKRWWNIDYEHQSKVIDDQEAIEHFTYLFTDSVRLRLRSDVPIGTCLSGGLDSTSIATVANKLLFSNTEIIDPVLVGKQQKTFSACYEQPSCDERQYIEALIEKIGAEKNYVFPDGYQKLWEELPDLIWHLEEPCGGTSMYAQWNVLRHVSNRGVKVALNGQGGDEVLAGYPKYAAFFMQEMIRAGKIGSFLKELQGLNQLSKKRIPSDFVLLAYLMLPRWVKSTISDIALRLTRRKSFYVLQEDFRYSFSNRKHGSADVMQGKFNQSLREELYSDITTFVLPALLRYEDRISMAFSVETRLPFLDYRLVEFAFSLPAQYLICDGWSKWVLRQSMKDSLPGIVCWRRDKMGFQTPEALWLQVGKSQIHDLFSDQNLRSVNYLNQQRLLSCLDTHLDGGDNHLWRWINLELWMRKFDL